jgi:hypothetical protein
MHLMLLHATAVYVVCVQRWNESGWRTPMPRSSDEGGLSLVRVYILSWLGSESAIS